MNINENGDLIITDGELTRVDEIEDIRLELQCVFNTHKNEFFLDPDLGIDYDQFVDKRTTEERQRLIIMDGISQVERITEINDIQITTDSQTRQSQIFIDVSAGDLRLTDTITIGGE